MEPSGTFGRRLRALLMDRGVAPGELAMRIYGVPGHDATVSRWLHYKCEPGYANLHAIRDALGCTWEELMG